MAKNIKCNALKLKENSAKQAEKGSSKVKPKLRVVEGRKKPEAAKICAAPNGKKALSKDKGQVSQRLLETIERRKKEQDAKRPFGKPQGRRGRRPKALAEYVAGQQNQEEENLNYDAAEYEGLEYDTGIRVKERKDDPGFSFERFEDYDEELNFDW